MSDQAHYLEVIQRWVVGMRSFQALNRAEAVLEGVRRRLGFVMGACMGCHGRLPQPLVGRSRLRRLPGVGSFRGAGWVPGRLVRRGCMEAVRLVRVLDCVALLMVGSKALLAGSG